MLSVFKKYLPESIRKKIRLAAEYVRKKNLIYIVNKKHNQALVMLKGKQKIRVVFLAIHRSVWKVDSVFQRMLKDPVFDPLILVCPYTVYGERLMLSELEYTIDYFQSKKYPVINSYEKETDTWVDLKDLHPDIVFFTNPHNLTRPEYYSGAYENYLSCYVPYYFMATKHAGDISVEVNTRMLLSMWRIYWPHQFIYEESKKESLNKGENGLVTGYPAMEFYFHDGSDRVTKAQSSWKKQTSIKKKIIYSPHHSIEETDQSLSMFLSIGEKMIVVAKKNKDSVQWSFKPHPLLKEKLYLHHDWGKDKTDSYYNFWSSQEYTQLDEGEYEKLFMESDAIIHDCSSFIVEYAFTNKPALYLINKNRLMELLNEFGEKVISVYELANSESDIYNFIDQVVSNKWRKDESDYRYFKDYVGQFYERQLPSLKIIEDIKNGIEVNR